MRNPLRILWLASLGVFAWESASAESTQNIYNNPLTDIPAIQFQDYAQPFLRDEPGSGSNNPTLRAILPHKTLGVPQMLRASLPAAATAWTPSKTETGFGDLEIFNVPLLESGNLRYGVGPLLVIPTATSKALGDRVWQLGAEVVVSAPMRWGLLATLISYQQPFGGQSPSFDCQPFLFYNLPAGFYLRSSAISSVNLEQKNAVIPIGLGIGHIGPIPNKRAVLNVYVEPQYSVLQTGQGIPVFQIFAGFNIQFPP
jgi:hypothetical protein